MKTIEDFVRINKIEGNVFMSFDLDALHDCDEIACGALKAECPKFIMPIIFDNSTTTETIRYSVPAEYKDLVSDTSELEILDVLKLYRMLLSILDECGDWYLLPSGFCFDEKYVYVDAAHDQMKFIYFPDNANTFTEQDIKHLMITLLEKCSEESGGSIQLQLYKYFYKPKFSVKEFNGMLEGYLEKLDKKQVKKEDVKEETVDFNKPVTPSKESTYGKSTVNKGIKKANEPVQSNLVKEKPAEPVVSSIKAEAKEPAKHYQETEKDANKEIEEIEDPRSFYTPKVNRSQLSQEEIEEMVKSIYSGKTPEEKLAEETVAEPVEKQYGAPEEKKNSESTSFYTRSRELESTAKRKNLFDNVFNNTATSKTAPAAKTAASNGVTHYAVLKSISMHARYDLPKQIDIAVDDNEAFVIGRATRTGEPTGASYEFSAEITPISRLHAQLEYKDEAYYIKDLGSSNGTFLNGTKLEANKPYLIEDGDKVAFAIAYSKNSIEYAFAEN